MRAVVYTDVLQFSILIIGLPLTFFVGLHYVGGIQSLVKQVPKTHLFFLNSSRDWWPFILLFVTFIFGEALVPPYVQRLFMAKTSGHTRNGTLTSGLISIPLFLIVGAIGLIAYALNKNLDPSMAVPYVIQTVLPVAVRGFVIASILAVIMSSAAGFLNAAAVSFVNDIIRPLAGEKIKQRGLLQLAKWATFFIGAASVIFALMIKNILDILLYAYNFWAPVILVPLIAAIFNIKAKTHDFFFGATGGIATLLLWTTYHPHEGYGRGVVIGTLGNLIFFTLSYLLITKLVAPMLLRKEMSQA